MGLFGNMMGRNVPMGTPGFNPHAPQPGGKLGSIFDRLVNPQNSMGQLGHALLMGGGNIGNALALMQQQRLTDQQQQRQQERDAAEDEYRRQVLEARQQVDPTTLQRNVEYFKTLSPEDQALVRPMMTGYAYTPEGVQIATDRAGAIADVQGRARMNYRPAQAAKAPRVGKTKVVNGVAYYQVNGRWYDNPEGR